MKKFKSISELTILKYAYYELLEKSIKEEKLITNNADKKMSIAKYRKKVYDLQMDEIHERILELEKL